MGDHGCWTTRDDLKIHIFSQPSTKKEYKVGTLYKNKNAAKGQEKFVFLKTVAFNIFQHLMFVGKSDWSMNPGRPWWLDD